MPAELVSTKQPVFSNRLLYLSVAVLALLTFGAALGPGLFNVGSTWQYLLFDKLCHQIPSRSYSVNGTQMAVCSRCIGIYGAFTLGWLLMVFISMINSKTRRYGLKLLSFVLLLNFTDIIGNYFGFWSNTLHSRLLFGALLGFAAVFLLADEFFNLKTKKTE